MLKCYYLICNIKKLCNSTSQILIQQEEVIMNLTSNIRKPRQFDSKPKENTNKQSLANKIFSGISEIFIPILGVLCASGILKGILAILATTSLLPVDSQTHLILNAMADSLFFFLPFLLAYTSSKKFGADPFVAVVIAGILLYPSIFQVMSNGESIQFFMVNIRPVTYSYSVLPILMATGLLSFLEKWLKHIIPELVRSFVVPLISILVVGFITLYVFGPIGALIGEGLATGYGWAYNLSPIIAGLLLGALIQPMVIFGFHWAFVLIAMSNIALHGSDTILALLAPAVFAQMGAAFAVMLKSKDKKFKSICFSAAISAFLGVTEPAMFGVNIPRRKPMLAVIIAGGVGGAVAGISGAEAITFAFPSIVTLPIFLGSGFPLFVISCVVGLILSFVLTMIMKFDVDL